jgi:hypothetical protein
MAVIEKNSEPLVSAVSLGGTRGGPDKSTLRKDLWWLNPAMVYFGLLGFVLYGVWAAFRDGNYYAGAQLGRDYISPFYSPCITNSCPVHTFGWDLVFWKISPALLILIFPMGFRLSCYYYRKAYYRSFWLSPPACAVADNHRSYSGETKFPLILNNIHRYFWYFALIFAGILTYDAVLAFRFPNSSGGVSIGMGLGTLVLVINAVLIWIYTISCHSCRHLCGGQVDQFSKHKIRHKLWSLITPLNRHHQLFAWLSLFWVAFTDFYIWLVASGHITDPRFF